MKNIVFAHITLEAPEGEQIGDYIDLLNNALWKVPVMHQHRIVFKDGQPPVLELKVAGPSDEVVRLGKQLRALGVADTDLMQSAPTGESE